MQTYAEQVRDQSKTLREKAMQILARANELDEVADKLEGIR